MEHPVAEYDCQSCGYKEYRMTKKTVGSKLPNSCPECEGDLVIESKGEIPQELKKIVTIVDKHFYLWDFVVSPTNKEFFVESENPKNSFQNLLEDLGNEGMQAKMDEGDEELKITVEDAPRVEENEIIINFILLIATIITTFGLAGYWYLYDGNLLLAGLFSSSLLLVFLTHEIGHKIFSWKNKVDSTWPYFLPVPLPIIGTFGAIMKSKIPIPSKEALVEIGSAGPFLGFILAIPISTVGIHYSNTIPTNMFQAPFDIIPIPLVYYLITSSIFDGLPSYLDLHPLAWSGFIGLYATWLNLIPAGELDGGHIVRSFLSKKRHMDLTLFLIIFFISLGLIIRGSGLVFLALGFIILLFLGNPHPGALDDATEPGKKHKIIAGLAFTVFILCFPIPI